MIFITLMASLGLWAAYDIFHADECGLDWLAYGMFWIAVFLASTYGLFAAVMIAVHFKWII